MLTQLQHFELARVTFQEISGMETCLGRLKCLTYLDIFQCSDIAFSCLHSLRGAPLIKLRCDFSAEEVAKIDVPLSLAVLRASRAS